MSNIKLIIISFEYYSGKNFRQIPFASIIYLENVDVEDSERGKTNPYLQKFISKIEPEIKKEYLKLEFNLPGKILDLIRPFEKKNYSFIKDNTYDETAYKLTIRLFCLSDFYDQQADFINKIENITKKNNK